jgi:hypothetical protein
MKKIFAFASFALMAAAFAVSSAQALPAASTSGVSKSSTILVADGCGRHYHRNRHGHCRHN